MSVPSILFGFMPKFFHSQLFTTPPPPTQDCTGKTIIVTGANVGLGKEAARHYVRLNADKVILACRSLDKGAQAKIDIESSTKRTGVVDVWQLDLASYSSVKEFAGRVKTLPRLDIIIENAGIATRKFSLAEENESTVSVNVVSTFLLAFLVLPKLQETARQFGVTPTLTIVSSEVHFLTAFPERKSASIFDTLNNEKEARMTDRYNVSKLLEVLTCREWTQRQPVSQMKVTVNFVNPGFCYSELMREVTGFGIAAFKRALARTTEEGSRTLVHAGLSGPETHGKYLSDCKVQKCAPLVEGSEGPAMQKRVWEELCAKLEKIESGILKVLDG